MTTFNIIGMNTGFLKGTVKGIDYQDAENKCFAKGIDMYDEYMLIDAKQEVKSGIPYIEEILNG
jgi:hypothetical protein